MPPTKWDSFTEQQEGFHIFRRNILLWVKIFSHNSQNILITYLALAIYVNK